jgi:type IV secretory pathway TrbL component
MPCSSCKMTEQVSPTYETTGQITPHNSYILFSLIRCNYFFFHLLSKNIIIKIYVTIILLAVLCGCQTCFLTPKEEDRLRVIENWVLMKMLGPKGD